MGLNSLFRPALLALISGCLMAGSVAAEAWSVSLTKNQTKAIAEMGSYKKNFVFAISPDGAWGRSREWSTMEEARRIALGYCRSYVKKGQRDCIVYSENGKRVVQDVVEVKRVKAHYKPINPKKAAQFFGYAGINFSGKFERASVDAKRLRDNPALRKSVARDKGLEAALLHKSFTNPQKGKGFVIWFGKGFAQQKSQGKSGALVINSGDWIATPDGLVCMFDARWDNGRVIGTRCFVLEQISNGKGKFRWLVSDKDHSDPGLRNAGIIAGDARFGAVRY